MGKRVVAALYKSLLVAVQDVKQNLDSHNTVFSAIRNGAILAYDDLVAQRERELEYQKEIDEIEARQDHQLTQKVPFGIRKLVRPYFDAPLANKSNKTALNRRLDKGFKKLRQLNEHLSLIEDFAMRGAFEPRTRSPDMKFCVGEVVVAKGVGVGVICGWKRSNVRVDATVKQEVLYDVVIAGEFSSRRKHLRHFREEELELRFDQDDSKFELSSQLQSSPWILTCFDGFSPSLRRFRPSFALNKRYPKDFTAFDEFHKRQQAAAPPLPSFLHLEHLDDDQLVQYYLSSDDVMVSQCAMSVLMGRWKSECGPAALAECDLADSLMNKSNLRLARQMLLKVTNEFPEYSYALQRLGTVTYSMHADELNADVSVHESSAEAEAQPVAAKNRVVEAMEYYERALSQKPFMLDALFGLGMCAMQLGHFPVAHDAATRILLIQPDNVTAKTMLEKAVTETL